jgi:PhnB protein
MAQIKSYLTFNGNCREAMEFYRQCLGGDLMLQTIGETPMADKMPDNMKSYILHAHLKAGDLEIMATDMVGEKGLQRGNGISLMLDCGSEADLRNYFTLLSVGGDITHPVERTFWDAYIGDFTDKYGNNWVLHFENK